MEKRVEKNIWKRGDYSFRVRMLFDGIKIDKTFDTLLEARAYRDRHKADAALDEHEAHVIKSRVRRSERQGGYSLGNLIDEYRDAVSVHKKGYENSEKFRLNKLASLTIANRPLYLIHRPEILEALSEIGGSDANRKRYFNLLHHMFSFAIEKQKLDKNPCSELGKTEIPKDSKPRDRRLVGSEYERLLKHLSGDSRALFVLYVETGCRKSELLNLSWSSVNIKKRFFILREDETKTAAARTVALSSAAIAALEELKSFRDKKGSVFSISDTTLKRHWTAAKTAAGVRDLRIHDLRHEAASRFFEKGLNVIEAAQMTGHKSLQMLKRYTHLSPTDIAKKLG